MSKNKALLGVAVLLATLVLVLLPATASAHHPWLNYHWARESNPFSLQIGNNLSNFWAPSLPGAIADWNESSVLDLHVVPGSTNGQDCIPRRGRVEVCNADYGPTNWLGITRVWTLDGNHITQATVRLNDLPIVNNPAYGPEWRPYLLCHEIGHTFGLDHQDEDWFNAPLHSCLDLVQNVSNSTHPNQADYDTLEYIYAHLDLFHTFDPFVNLALVFGNSGNDGNNGRGWGGAGSQESVARPNKIAKGVIDPSWGQAISKDGLGQANIFELDLGNGEKVTTFVDWVPPADTGRLIH